MPTDRDHRPPDSPQRGERRFLAHTLIAGGLALGWLLLRSGTKPSRLTYPCQQAAISTASLAFGAPLVLGLLVLKRRVATPLGLVLAVVGLVTTAGLWGYLSQAEAVQVPAYESTADINSQVFHATGSQGPVGDHFARLDYLIEMMGAQGLKFYQSPIASLTAGETGVVGADDVLVLKINYQWDERGGTNTDLLKGLIRRIVDHPDGFEGEVVVAENAQFNSTSNFDRPLNNAENTSLSPHDVVVYFQNLGYQVSHFDWTPRRNTEVAEFSEGNFTSGYVVYEYDAVLHGRISYPKFTTTSGTRISLRDGIWDESASSYDRDRLKFINLPMLKSHHATYGATACVKNYMGVVTGYINTNSHSAIQYGILGGLMGEIGVADLNILDCTWINANPNDGPWTTYGGATRMDALVASIDPVAADIWSVKNILIPAFLANGYSPPWPNPDADPDDPSSDFRVYLDASMSHIQRSGQAVTNNLASIEAIELGPPGEASDPNGGGAPFTISREAGGYELAWSDPVRGDAATEFNLYRMDLLAPGPVTFPECEASLGNGTTQTLATLPDNHGFLVVARNSVGDGSFGSSSRPAERPSPAAPDVCP